MNHDEDKNYFQKYAKSILEDKKVLFNIEESESPDLIIKKDRIGIEVTKVFQNDKLDGYIKKFGKDIKDIEKFNEGYIKNGGKVFHKDSEIAKILKLKTGKFDKNYAHIEAGYNDNDFNLINKHIENKLERLNNKYVFRKDLTEFHLTVVTPMNFTIDSIKKEIYDIDVIQDKWKHKYKYIYIINNNVIIFNTTNKTYKIV